MSSVSSLVRSAVILAIVLSVSSVSDEIETALMGSSGEFLTMSRVVGSPEPPPLHQVERILPET
jgi:hypothetical protein